ncbi:hypothetical protein EBR37_04340 [bacterium]|nr:hypothetical protein [bacterium]
MAKKTKSTNKAYELGGRIIVSSTFLILAGLALVTIGWIAGGTAAFTLYGFGGAFILISAVIAATQLG